MNILAIILAVTMEPLWPSMDQMPDRQPQQIAAPMEVARKPGFKPDDHRMPYLEWCEAPNAAVKTDVCVVLISGGSYSCTCDGPAFRPYEKRLLEAGVTCVYLWYRTPRPQGKPIYQSGWEDGQRAIRLVRSQAAKRGYNPEKIGVLGCSAGSHLSLMLATSSQTPAYAKVDVLDDLPCHVNFAITHCPAYVLSDGLTNANSRDGDAPDVRLNPSFKFDAKTCPICSFHGSRDPYSPNGSTQIYRQLRRMKIPAELHLDAGRGHGSVPAATFERAIEFMHQLGILELKKPVSLMSRYPNDAARGDYKKENIWPAGKTPDVQTNQCTPYIEWHFPKERKTAAIQIVYSGGSYCGNSPDGFEVAPFRRYLNEKGMTVVTMKYRTPRPAAPLQKHVTAWQDLQRAIRLVRSQAKGYGLDPNRIGIMGSSAGGHLTLMGATSSKHRAYNPIDDLDKLPCNANWAVAIYPAYALTDGGERHNVSGGNADDARLVPEFSFDLATCPIVFVHGDADGWASMNSVKCWEQLRRMGIDCDLHALALRPHCFQREASPETGSYTWMDRAWEFMTKKGFNK